MARKQTRQPARRAEPGKPAKAIVSEKLVNRLAERYGVPAIAFLDSLRNTIFKVKGNEQPFDDMEIAAALVLCEQYDLNPFAREIYVTRNRGLLLLIVPIDGWVKICNRQDGFDGVDFEWEGDDADDDPVSCTATIHIKDRGHPIRVTEYFSECFQPKSDSDNDPWRKWPRRMLRHKAFIQAIRYAFGLTALDDDEAERLGYRVPDYSVQTDIVRPIAAAKPARKARQAPVEVRASDPPPDVKQYPDSKGPFPNDETAEDADQVEAKQEPPDLGKGAIGVAPPDNVEVVAFKNKLLDEVRQFARDLTNEEFDEVRKAAGGTMFNLECGVAELEAAIHKAEEIVEGKKE